MSKSKEKLKAVVICQQKQVFVNVAVYNFYYTSQLSGDLFSDPSCLLAPTVVLSDYLWVIPRSSHVADGYSLLLRLQPTRLACKIMFMCTLNLPLECDK